MPSANSTKFFSVIGRLIGRFSPQDLGITSQNVCSEAPKPEALKKP
jgi:hypothetical protein